MSHNLRPFATPDDSSSSNPISSVSSFSTPGKTPVNSNITSSPHDDVDISTSSVDNVAGDVLPTHHSTPCVSISPQSAFQSIHDVCNHPSQGVGHPDSSHHVRSSQSSHHFAMQESSTILATESAAGCGLGSSSGMVRDQSESPTSTSPITSASLDSLHERVTPHTPSGCPSVAIGFTRASSSPAPAPAPAPGQSVSSVSVTTSSRSASIPTLELLRDEVDFRHQHNGSSHLNSPGKVRVDEEHYRSECGPPVGLSSFSDDGTGSNVQAREKQATKDGNAYDDLDLSYIIPGFSEGSIRSFDSRLSFVQGDSGRPISSHLSSIVPFAASEASLPLDESFLRHIHKYDRNFDAGRHYWSFTRAKEDPSMSNAPPKHPSNTDQAQSNMSSRVQETWRCGHVGRFRVRRTVFEAHHADPTKGAAQQIHVRQIMDRNSANGSSSVIHKHPRAIAFSMFRTPSGLAGSKPGNEVSASTSRTHMNIRSGIMLAPKNIQQRYASTQSTSTHNDSQDLNKGPGAAPFDRKGKGKERLGPGGVIGTRSPSNNTSQLSRMSSAREPAASPASPTPSPPHSDNLASNVLGHDRFPSPLTPLPHKAGAPPASTVEMSRTNNHGSVSSGSTLTERFIRVIRGSSRTDTPSPSLAGMFQSMISSSRTPQEEDDLINHLNASFKAVGLLPSKTGKPPISPFKRKSDHTFLGQIPDDCLCMTLPLWVSETGGVNIQPQETDATLPAKIPANNRFLVVYYVPNTEACLRGANGQKSQKEDPQDSKSVHLPAFYVVARVINHGELLQSGLKVPSGGLAVDSPEQEAIGYPASTSHREVELTNTVVCYCHSRERGFEFVEDGLCQLGLCTQGEIHDPLPVAEEDEREGEILLTPIGKVVVEIIWLGCLAITSFGPRV